MRWFEIALVVLTLLSGLVWLLDNLFLAKRRAANAGLLDEGREPWYVLRQGLLPGAGDRAGAAQLRCRAIPHPVELDDAHPADRRLHPGQQVRLRPAPADQQHQD